jgi:hypothetical protein
VIFFWVACTLGSRRAVGTMGSSVRVNVGVGGCGVQRYNRGKCGVGWCMVGVSRFTCGVSARAVSGAGTCAASGFRQCARFSSDSVDRIAGLESEST